MIKKVICNPIPMQTLLFLTAFHAKFERKFIIDQALFPDGGYTKPAISKESHKFDLETFVLFLQQFLSRAPHDAM